MNRRQKLVQQQFLNNEQAVVSRLEYIYDQSLNEVNDKIKNLEFAIGDLQEQYDWADDSEKEVIRSKIQSKIYQKQYQEQLQSQLDGILNQMQTKQFLTISDYLDTCYEDGFIGSIFDMHGQNVPLMMPINQESMVRAVQLDSKINQGLYTKLGEDVGVLKKRITAEVTRSIATGSSWGQVAKRLAGQTKIGYNKAVRIARTEGHRIQCTAAMDAAQQAKERGADVLKQWDATLDDVTRESHMAVDGEIRELDKPFSNSLMFPGDPKGGAAEVVNCRCALLQRARWALDEDELKTLQDRAAFFGLDKSAQFDDFKKNYLKSQQEMDGSFAWQLANTRLSPHTHDYRTAEEFWEARKAFIANGGQESDYLDDVFRKDFDFEQAWGTADGKHKVARIEHTLAELQKQYPINPLRELEYGTTIKKMRVCDYDYAHMYLPDGADDRRLVDSAVGQVFENDGREVVIAFGRDWMYQTLDEAIEERSSAIALGKVLDSVNGASPETVAMHEWGHLMSNHITNAMINGESTAEDYWTWYKTLSEDEIRQGLSDYATTNRGEFEAECFAELMMPNPRPLALKYKEYLDRCIELGY